MRCKFLITIRYGLFSFNWYVKNSAFDSFKNFMIAPSAFGEIVFSLSRSVELLHLSVGVLFHFYSFAKTLGT